MDNAEQRPAGEQPVSERRVEKRVVEAEVKLPKLSEMELPKPDLRPVLRVAEEVFLTGLGLGVLMARGLGSAVKAAHEAGVEASKNPGPMTKAVLDVFRQEPKTKSEASSGTSVRVRVLPVDNYDNLSTETIMARLPELSKEQLRLLRSYEADHQNRADVILAIDRRLME